MIALPQELTSGVKGVGIDLASIPRITRWIDGCDRETLALLFAPGEIHRCQSATNPQQLYALCFATKEAVGKALGTGFADIDWHEIEADFSLEKANVCLHGKAKIQAQKLGIRGWFVTWCHCDNHVLVHVLAE